MIKVLSQTNLDLVMFIGDNEIYSKIVGLNFGLLKKGFYCEGVGSISSSSITEDNANHIGLRVRFTKTTRPGHKSIENSFFKRKTNIDNTEIEMKLSKGVKYNKKTEITFRVTPSNADCVRLLENDILSNYSRHIKTTRDMATLPDITTSADIKEEDFRPKTDEEKVAGDLHLDTVVTRVKEFEENYKHLYPLLMMRNFTGISNTTTHDMSLAEFCKFSKQVNVIKEVSIPTICARKKFIELCDIFKNNKVLTTLKANNFEFRKDHSNSLIIEFFGVSMVKETGFNHFKYLDHPGINFCADYLDKSRTFDIVEAKISKEIITRI